MPIEMPQDDDTRRVMDGLRRIVRVLSTSSHKPSGRGGLTGAQAFVLGQVAANPGLSLGDLASRTLTGQSTVSGVVARLVDRRLVVRGTSPVDARQAVLTPTASGKRMIARAEHTAQQKLATGLAVLDPGERRALATALESWLEASGLQEIPATMFFER